MAAKGRTLVAKKALEIMGTLLIKAKEKGIHETLISILGEEDMGKEDSGSNNQLDGPVQKIMMLVAHLSLAILPSGLVPWLSVRLATVQAHRSILSVFYGTGSSNPWCVYFDGCWSILFWPRVCYWYVYSLFSKYHFPLIFLLSSLFLCHFYKSGSPATLPTELHVPAPEVHDQSIDFMVPAEDVMGTDVAPATQNTHRMTTRSKDGTLPPSRFIISRHPSAFFVSAAMQEPQTFAQTRKHSTWRAAMEEEYMELLHNHTWNLVPPLPAQNVVGCKWVYRIK
ncbi:hypothetical protein CRG98_037681 [Punica granatum]|uniref:Reverse transcriptase Ty1/copia-type domain-containing protein n=1 Tax=Punica granatum TaxID=22663 RepID=A0A2I0ID69_PUNGR|nr:hypothetical protein CRG98_037681 [Punica granatum]